MSIRIALALGCASALTGCISMAPAERVPATVAALPDEFSTTETAGEYRPAAWWSAFNDPVLDGLVERALSSNLDIVEAAARVEQASAQARIARAGLFPSIDASGSGSYSDSPLAGSAFGQFAGGASRIENETYSLSLGAAYELDLFGRVRNDFRAARADALGSEFDFRAVQLASAAETISTYFDVVDGRRQIELAVQIAEVLEDRAARTDERFERGLVQSFELYQVRQDLRSTQASIPQQESALASHNGRLALLLGTYPDQIADDIAGPLQPRLVFEPIPQGLPSQLLSQRPDVAAAWARLEAARLRIGARRAERFPRISLSGSLGTQSDEPSGAFDTDVNWTASLASNIVAPIFNAGRITANIKSARAVYDQRAAAYARSVLSAYREVESALADYEEQRQRYELITAQLREAEASFDLQRRRFAAGVGSYITYLDARRTLLQVESNLSSSAKATAMARLGVHRALGGDWAPQSAPQELEMRKTNQSPPTPASQTVRQDRSGAS